LSKTDNILVKRSRSRNTVRRGTIANWRQEN